KSRRRCATARPSVVLADALLLVAAGSACIVYLVMAVLARRRERELARSRAHEARLKSLTELSADWLWETDAEHCITWLSGRRQGAPGDGARRRQPRRMAFRRRRQRALRGRRLGALSRPRSLARRHARCGVLRHDPSGGQRGGARGLGARAEGRGSAVRGRIP